MTWPNVNVSQINRYNGTTDEVERVVLFVGYGKTNVGITVPLNTGTDFDVALGKEDSLLKRLVKAALINAGQNFFAYAHVMPERKNLPTENGDGQKIHRRAGRGNRAPRID